MSPYGIRAVDDEPHGCPRWIIKVAIVCIVIFAVIMLRMMIGLGSAYAYYRTTQDFDSFVAARAVPDEVIEDWLPNGALLAQNEPWSLGEDTEPDSGTLALAVDINITHGEQTLLNTTVLCEAKVDPETWSRRSFTITPPTMQVRPGMHAVVQVGVGDLTTLAQGAPGRSGSVTVDVLLAAGEGQNVFRVVELDRDHVALGDPFASRGLRELLGFVHPSGELPEEGWLMQARARFDPGWRRLGNNSSGAARYPSELRLNCHDYSYETTVTTRNLRNGRESTRHSNSWSQNYTWNEHIW